MTTAALYSLTTNDGYTEYFDSEAAQSLVSLSGIGSPSTQFQVQRGYKHHGETEISYMLQSRTVAVQLWAEHQTDKQAYFDLRARILDLMRPNRGGPMVLTVQLPDMARRSLLVRGNPGPIYPANENENFWGLLENIELIAFDPIWFNPDAITISGAGAGTSGDELEFPIEFPIRFGADDSAILATGDFTYAGTWDSYPIVTLTGPYTSAQLVSSVLSAYVALIVPIAAGEQRIIDLTPGSQRILDGNGDSRFGELSAESNLLDFAIKPAPTAPDGIQALSVIMSGHDVNSAATLSYNERYFAI